MSLKCLIPIYFICFVWHAQEVSQTVKS